MSCLIKDEPSRSLDPYFKSLMKKILFLLTVFFLQSTVYAALSVEGTYQGKNLYVQNPMDEEGFGNCSNHGECEAVCPKGISISNIARMRREYIRTLIPTK